LDWGNDHVERVEEILQLFQENLNQILPFGEPYITKTCILTNYHYTQTAALWPEDSERRLNFCMWLLEMDAQNPTFIPDLNALDFYFWVFLLNVKSIHVGFS
jgi:hypothetical protein